MHKKSLKHQMGYGLYFSTASLCFSVFLMNKVFKPCMLILALLSCIALATENPDLTKIKSDIDLLIKASAKLDTAWPWQGVISETSLVAKHGNIAAPLLLDALIKNSDKNGEPINIHVVQQIELALCLIYGLKDESGITVYGIRSFKEKNSKIIEFWRHKVKQSHDLHSKT